MIKLTFKNEERKPSISRNSIRHVLVLHRYHTADFVDYL